MEKCESKDEIIKTGLAGKLQRVMEDLGNKDSTLHKTVKGFKHGVKITQDIAKKYNAIAEWAGLPQVLKPLL